MRVATKNYLKLFHEKRSRFLEEKRNEVDTSKLEVAAIETLLGSKKKATLLSVFPRVKLANKYNNFSYPNFRIFSRAFRQYDWT